MLRTLDEVKDYLIDTGNEDVIIFQNPDYATAFLGITTSGRAVYDFYKMVDWLTEHCKMSGDEAVAYICLNENISRTGREPLILNSVEESLWM